MRDGDRHAPVKRAVAATLESSDGLLAAAASREWAQRLAGEIQPQLGPGRLQEFSFRLPVSVVASLLGVGRDLVPPTAAWTAEVAACFAPAATPEHVERGGLAAAELRHLFQTLASARQAESPAGPPRASPAPASAPRCAAGGGLLATLMHQAERAGWDDGDLAVANGVGLLVQTYEATAGLIGNTLVSLAAHRGVRAQVRADPARLGAVIEEVLRFDPPVQNTRRFVARSGRVAGAEMREGDVVLVLLAAANRDPAAFCNPARFELARQGPRPFSFGAGVHACPGQALAATIAEAGVERLLAAGVDPEELTAAVTYRPSLNLRLPQFNATERRSKCRP